MTSGPKPLLPRNAVAPMGVALVYAGICVGVAFIAVPAKFLAESVTLTQALDVGRWEFRIFGWVDLAAAVGLVAAAWLSFGARRMVAPLVILSIVLTQKCVLRPILDERLLDILKGGTPPPSSIHSAYGALEAAKALILLGYGVVLGWRLTRLATQQVVDGE